MGRDSAELGQKHTVLELIDREWEPEMKISVFVLINNHFISYPELTTASDSDTLVR